MNCVSKWYFSIFIFKIFLIILLIVFFIVINSIIKLIIKNKNNKIDLINYYKNRVNDKLCKVDCLYPLIEGDDNLSKN